MDEFQKESKILWPMPEVRRSTQVESAGGQQQSRVWAEWINTAFIRINNGSAMVHWHWSLKRWMIYGQSILILLTYQRSSQRPGDLCFPPCSMTTGDKQQQWPPDTQQCLPERLKSSQQKHWAKNIEYEILLKMKVTTRINGLTIN